ncbi:voltage-gated potassium channel [Pontibacter ummariensis]|uniref:Voltage-gated potassium channel n=1 Tax=Pontibacter ummariensis TaxID=1610492 RepID=A0A239L8Y2_9BACT|nr:potassium channel family protein [Pontibacter ummariensis]PRY04002.1 voltage-gated potassium channel [Pontibacter ummariensis]SNT26775.1 voltage-gated potassium channel [Pontibacter ummariensis]
MFKPKPLLITLAVLLFFAACNFLLVQFEADAAEASITDVGDAVWYMFVTLTTVGYGDMFPVTPAGKVIGYIYVFSSLGVLGFLFSTISSKIQKILEDRKLGFHGTDFKDHILFVGWGDFSRLVADEVYHSDKKMAIITSKRDDIDLIYSKYSKDQVFVLFSEFNNFELLTKVNAHQAATLFISFDDDSEALLYVINFRKRYPEPEIVVSLQKLQLKETFKAAGVTYVITKNEIASKLVASYIFEPDVADMNLDLLSTARQDEDYDIQQYQVLAQSPFANRDSEEVFHELKTHYNSILLGLSKTANGKRELIKNPPAGTLIETGDYLIMMSSGKAKAGLRKVFKEGEGRILRD